MHEAVWIEANVMYEKAYAIEFCNCERRIFENKICDIMFLDLFYVRNSTSPCSVTFRYLTL